MSTASSSRRDELAELRKRGQPPVIDNRIKTKIDYLVGLEKQQRVKPKAFPRTPQHEDDADGATEALRYVAEQRELRGEALRRLAQHAGRGRRRHSRVCRAVALCAAVEPDFDP